MLLLKQINNTLLHDLERTVALLILVIDNVEEAAH